MKNDYDIIIVGAGPAGLSTAKAVSEKGLRCLVLDKSREIGFPVRTSGGSWIQDMLDLKIPETCYNPVSEVSFVAPTEKATLSFDKPVACILDVTELNRFLACRAKHFGTELLLESQVNDVLIEEGFVTGVEANIDGRVQKIRSRIVVDASGLSATLVKKVGLLKYWPRVALGVQFDVASPKINPEKVVLYVGNKIAPAGYGWVFPWKNNRARIGVGIIRPDSFANPLRYAQDLLNNDQLVGLKNDFKILGKEAGVFPSSGPLEKTIANGFVAVGDSAGQGSPLHGEGIRYAIYFGIMAGTTICDAFQKKNFSTKTLQKYERAWRQKEGRNFRIGLAIQKRISKYDDAQWDSSVRYLGKIGLNDPETVIQLFRTDFSYRNLWRTFQHSPIQALKTLLRGM